jgi:medium-chain acyl-[acyl-carrier-protein] hydrolase
MGKFSVEYTVDYQSLNADLTVTFPRFLDYLQETSIRHTDSSNYPIKWYVEQKMAWVITNWWIRITRYPTLHEKIKVSTFPTAFKGAIGERGFEAFDERGNILVKAFTNWLLVDLIENKPIRPTADMINCFGSVFEPPTSRKMDFLPISDAYELISEREYKAVRHDIDPNNHVNNVRYVEWVFDDIPDTIYQNYQPYEIKIIYRKQCFRGEILKIQVYKKEDTLVSLIKKANDTIVAEIYSKWKANSI